MASVARPRTKLFTMVSMGAVATWSLRMAGVVCLFCASRPPEFAARHVPRAVFNPALWPSLQPLPAAPCGAPLAGWARSEWTWPVDLRPCRPCKTAMQWRCARRGRGSRSQRLPPSPAKIPARLPRLTDEEVLEAWYAELRAGSGKAVDYFPEAALFFPDKNYTELSDDDKKLKAKRLYCEYVKQFAIIMGVRASGPLNDEYWNLVCASEGARPAMLHYEMARLAKLGGGRAER
mmetsp:Transcript_17721/g.40094  ORF Transcript_17721/g.40094 Transcript_17721/m.40094 type:complete len:234 (+) Transcript_17721:63-764(+)